MYKLFKIAKKKMHYNMEFNNSAVYRRGLVHPGTCVCVGGVAPL